MASKHGEEDGDPAAQLEADRLMKELQEQGKKGMD